MARKKDPAMRNRSHNGNVNPYVFDRQYVRSPEPISLENVPVEHFQQVNTKINFRCYTNFYGCTIIFPAKKLLNK
jgi:hypothetical protein